MKHIATIALNVLAALLLVSLLRAAGGRIRRRLLPGGTGEGGIFDIPLGTIPVVWVVFAAQMLGLYRPWVGFLLLGLGLVALFDRTLVADARRLAARFRTLTRIETALIGVMFLSVGLAGLAALAPPRAKDALVYHLTVQKMYVGQGGYAPVPGFIYSYFPQQVESLYAIGLLVGCDRLPALLHWTFGLCVLAGAYRLARTLGAARPFALSAPLALSLTPLFWFELTSPYVDLGLTTFTTLAFLAVLKWHQSDSRRWLALAGLMLGGALGVKYLALVGWLVVAGFFLALWIHREQGIPLAQGVRLAATLLVPGLVVCSPFLLRNVWQTGNPFFPFLWHLFPTHAENWDAERTQVLLAYIRYSDFPLASVGDVVALPFRVCLLAEHEVIRRFEGEIGPLHLGFLFSFFVWRHWSFPTKAGAVLVVAFFAYWATNSPLLRFLLPVLPFALAVVAVSFSLFSEKAKAEGPERTLPVGCLALWIGLFGYGAVRTIRQAGQDGGFAWLAGRQSETALLQSRYQEYEFFEWLNRETPPGTRVWLVDTGARTYYLQRPFVSDYVLEHETLARFVRESRNVDELAGKVQSLKVEYLLIAPELLFDPRTTPFETPEERERLRQYLQTRCVVVKAGERLVLLKFK